MITSPLRRTQGFKGLVIHFKYNRNSYESKLDVLVRMFFSVILLDDKQNLSVGNPIDFVPSRFASQLHILHIICYILH